MSMLTRSRGRDGQIDYEEAGQTDRGGGKTREMQSDKQIRMCIPGSQASCWCLKKTDCGREKKGGGKRVFFSISKEMDIDMMLAFQMTNIY